MATDPGQETTKAGARVKCIVTARHDATTRAKLEKIDPDLIQPTALILEEKNGESLRSRLPFLDEIAEEYRKKGGGPLLPGLVVLWTKEDVSPWDLLTDFPSENYWDYAHLKLLNLSGPTWDSLVEEDRVLLSQVPKDTLSKLI